VRSGGATLRWDPEAATSVGVRVYVDEQNTRLPGSLSLAQAQHSPTLTVNPNDYGSTRGSSATFFGSTTYKNIELAADVSVRNKDSSSTLPSLRGTTDSSANFVSFSPRAKIHNALVAGNDLSVGIDLSKWDRSYSSIYPAYPEYSVVNEQLTQRSYAIYLRDDWAINPVNRLTLGARLEEIDKSVANFGGVYSNPNTHNSLSALEAQYTRTLNQVAQAYLRAGQGYRVPNIDDLRGAGSALVPQTSVDYELGLNLQKLSPTNATVRVFKSNIHNEIIYDSTAGYGNNVNLPTTQRAGVELEGRYQAGDTVAFRGSLQRIRALFVEGSHTGRHVPLVPKLNAQAGVLWTPVIHHTIDLSARVVGRQPLDTDFANTLAPIPAYWTTDLRYTSQLTKRLAWIVAANNLLDRRYYDYANSGGYYPSPGLNIYTSLKLSF
jgi:iron complex outermembrane recepter protein